MVRSLIPQEVLIQEANKENIKISEEEIEKLVGLLVIESGLDVEEFEEQLKNADITIDDIKKSIESRTRVNKLFEKKNIAVNESLGVPLDSNNEVKEYFLKVIIEFTEKVWEKRPGIILFNLKGWPGST